MTSPAGPYPPNNALVAQAWLGSRVANVTADMVAGRLPRDPSVWQHAGFLAASVIGGTPDVDIPVRHALVQVDAYAVTLDAAGTVSVKPPVGKAYRLAELVRSAAEASSALYSKPVTMPANYTAAIVLSAYLVSEPREITDDPSGYARVTFDLMLDWARG